MLVKIFHGGVALIYFSYAQQDHKLNGNGISWYFIIPTIVYVLFHLQISRLLKLHRSCFKRDKAEATKALLIGNKSAFCDMVIKY